MRCTAVSGDDARSDERGWGMTLFRRHGFAGWCNALAAMHHDATRSEDTPVDIADWRVPETAHAPLVTMLSQLVLGRYREVVA